MVACNHGSEAPDFGGFGKSSTDIGFHVVSRIDELLFP